jgi:3-oxoadipate enol-lactonase
VLDTVDGAFCFVGLSLGGAVGMHLAARHPDRIERLVLACTSARFGDPQQWRERAALVRREGLEAIVDAVIPRWFGEGCPHADRYREMFLSIESEGYARCCDALASFDAAPDLSRITAPTLVVAGSDDPTSPPADAEAIAGSIPEASLAVIEGAHHLANVERPVEFNRLLEEFL